MSPRPDLWLRRARSGTVMPGDCCSSLAVDQPVLADSFSSAVVQAAQANPTYAAQYAAAQHYYQQEAQVS